MTIMHTELCAKEGIRRFRINQSMILLLGASGYIGTAFQTTLLKRGVAFLPVSRAQCDYTRTEPLRDLLLTYKPELVINTAGYTGKPNVDACETSRKATLDGNSLFPKRLSIVCADLGIPLGHVSTGCIFSGCHVWDKDGWRIETNMNAPLVRKAAQTSPALLRGYSEDEPPNFTFGSQCSFYSGTKALGESGIMAQGDNYIWRLRMPFDEQDHSRNYLTKLLTYDKVYDSVNSLSHRTEFARSCLDSWLKRIPFGIYNMNNSGFVSTHEVVDMIRYRLKPKRSFIFWKDDAEFYQYGAVAPRSNCILETSKLARAGVYVRPVQEALEESLRTWR